MGTAITDQFLDARLQELRWAVKVQEIIEEEKEEQRILKERLRDEALARKEAEKAVKEAERQAEEDRKMKENAEREARRRKELEEEIRAKLEATQRELLAKQRAEATEAEKSKIQEELDKLNAKLEEERRMREEARLKEAQDLLTATKNIVEGYGNEYLVPKESLFDQMAEEYGHEVAGLKLKTARDTTRKMIREGSSARSQIIDPHQNEAAKDFIVDAFNGEVS